MKISLIWAMSQNRVIGRNGQLPWNLPDEMRYFVDKTRGKPVIMGRKTFESTGGPLPKRLNLVVTSNKLRYSGVTVCRSVNQALEMGREHCTQNRLDELFVIGGTSIYQDTLPLADKLYETTIHGQLDGDTFFPEYDVSAWTLIDETFHNQDPEHAYAFSMKVLERKRN